MKYLILIFILNISSLYAASECDSDIQDLTLESNAQERKAFVNGVDDAGNAIDSEGVRVGLNGIKDMNYFYGLGDVNDILGCKREVNGKKVNGYEGNLRDTLTSAEFKEKNPEVKLKIYKTDFKGYHITCTPMPACKALIASEVSKIPTPIFPKPAKEKLKGKEHLVGSFKVNAVEGDSFKEAYIKGRVSASYGQIDMPLHEFIEKEMDAAIKKATGRNTINSIPADDPKFMKELSDNIDKFRSLGIESVDPKFADLVKVLDIMESPFASADNIEDEIDKALSKKQRVSSAKTGDDLFLIIKDGDKVEKIIGADARGLGVTNMTTRYQEYLKHRHSGQGIGNVETLIKVSEKAMKSADDIMDKSLNTYNDILVKELGKPNGRTVEQMIRAAHDKYNLLLDNDPELMQIRAGAIDDCGKEPKEIMNRITSIHNRLKMMEKANINGFFGMSCLGTEYFLRLSGLK